MQNVQAATKLDEWDKHKATLHVIADKDPELWTQLTEAHDQLSRMQRHGAEPPAAEQLTDLAARLRSFEF